ncbi:MAG TPA: HAD-IA family hydrolase [Negativicutes bacterium]|nr:HAD-IA family hydrolase [Negativicutes bacterium]
MKNIKAIIFDLDGTLLNTLDDLADSVNYALRQFGFPERSLEEVRIFVGNGVRNLMKRAVPGGFDNPRFEDCLNAFREYYSKHLNSRTKPYEGIIDLLSELDRGKYKMAIVSNKFDSAVKELTREFFSAYIPVAIGESGGVRKKPEPDCVFEALKELGTEASCAVYVGDSEVDVETARNAGLLCIGVTWGFRSRELLTEKGAEYIIDTPMELMKLLQ